METQIKITNIKSRCARVRDLDISHAERMSIQTGSRFIYIIFFTVNGRKAYTKFFVTKIFLMDKNISFKELRYRNAMRQAEYLLSREKGENHGKN